MNLFQNNLIIHIYHKAQHKTLLSSIKFQSDIETSMKFDFF
jgi:hypothetical protein